MESNIISGLVSGLIVTLFVVSFRAFWVSVIIPWFENRVYKDIKIEGKWFVIYPSTVNMRQEIVVLKRHGHTVTGEMTCIKGGDEGEQYNLFGSFRNMLLPMTYESNDKAKSDRGTVTLKCTNNGEKFRGKIAAYSTENDDIHAVNVLWFRSKKEMQLTIDNIIEHRDEMETIAKEKELIEKEEFEIENIETKQLEANEDS
jgi:hypothetical protein